jgi:Tol biopolymer transport system component
MNADGSGKRRVTPAPGGVDWVAWSPDGRQILFSSTAFGGAAALGGADTLAVVNSDGSGLESVFADTSRGSGTGGPLAWAPDGRIFFGRRSGSLGEICSLDRGGRGLTVVTATRVPPSFSLSRDGKWLAIWDGDSDRLVRMAANGRGMGVALVEEVSQYQGGGALSSWSPNGGQLVFGGDSRGWLGPGSVLHVAKADGSVVWDVPNAEDAYDPAWRPE